MTEVIGEIQKNTLEVIRASLTEYKDQERVDIRVYYQAGADADSLKPTRKGISLSIDNWNDFKALIKSVDEALNERE